MTISRIARQWVDEVELSLCTLFTVANQDKQNSERNISNFTKLKVEASNATSELFKQRQIKIEKISMAKDPILYFRDYEEY